MADYPELEKDDFKALLDYAAKVAPGRKLVPQLDSLLSSGLWVITSGLER
jgi:hypothetical protein